MNDDDHRSTDRQDTTDLPQKIHFLMQKSSGQQRAEKTQFSHLSLETERERRESHLTSTERAPSGVTTDAGANP